MKTKKYSIIGIALLSTILILGACNDEDTVEDPPTKETVKSEFGFKSFDLDIDTADQNDAIDATFDMDMSTTEAEYENKLESKKLVGNEAFDELETIFKGLELNKDTKKEEVIEKVSKAFGAEDYKEFDLEIEFSDGTVREYTDTKK